MPLLITDFDGVLCDSVWECLLAAYNMYNRLENPVHQRVTSLSEIPEDLSMEFGQMRPYLHGAEDFLPIFKAALSKEKVNSAADLNRFRDADKQLIEESKELFYTERDFLIKNEKNLWFTLNPLFPEIAESFAQLHPFNNVYILTTKRGRDVEEILRYNNIEFPQENIRSVETPMKIPTLKEISRRRGIKLQEMIYIEDQISFLPPALAAGCRVYLANWGYVSDEQRKIAADHSIPVIEKTEFTKVVNEVALK